MNRTATRMEQYHVGSHRHANWALKSPPAIRLALDGSLNNHALSTMPKAPERIRTEYARRGSPAVTPAVVREVAAALNLHEKTVERVLYALPRTPRPTAAPVPETKTMPPLNTAAVSDAAPVADARPLAVALLPADPPAWWFANLSWDTVRDLAAEVDRLTVDLRYGIPKSDCAKLASALGIQPQSIGTYATALRKACGIEVISVHKPKATGAASERETTTPAPSGAPPVDAPTPEPVAVAGEPPAGLAPEHQAVWRAWVAAGYSPTEYVGWHDKERLAVGLKIGAGKVHQAQKAWLEALGLPMPKAPDQPGAKRQAPAPKQGGAPPETVLKNQAPAAEPVESSRAPEILPDGGHIPHVPQPPTCQHCAGLGVADGCPDCGAQSASEPSSDHLVSPLAVSLAEVTPIIPLPVLLPPNWAPTADAIEALPDPLRGYIQDLEARAVPDGESRDLALYREELAGAEATERACWKHLRLVGATWNGNTLEGAVSRLAAMYTEARNEALAKDAGIDRIYQVIGKALDDAGVPEMDMCGSRILWLLEQWKAGSAEAARLESQLNDADADHRECIRLLTEAGADTSGETMALNLVQLIEERNDALAELQKLREETERERTLSQERWRTLNRYETALMPVLLCHPNGEPGETPLPDRLVTALQAMVAELEHRTPEVRVVRGLAAPESPWAVPSPLNPEQRVRAIRLAANLLGPSPLNWSAVDGLTVAERLRIVAQAVALGQWAADGEGVQG